MESRDSRGEQGSPRREPPLSPTGYVAAVSLNDTHVLTWYVKTLKIPSRCVQKSVPGKTLFVRELSAAWTVLRIALVS